PPPVHYVAPPVYHVPTAAQPPMQHQPVQPLDLALEPLPNNANDLYTSGTPADINMEDSMEDSQGESLSSQATLDILFHRDTDTYMQEPPMPREPSPVSKQLP